MHAAFHDLLKLLPEASPSADADFQANFLINIAVDQNADPTGWSATRETFEAFGRKARSYRVFEAFGRYGIEIAFEHDGAAALEMWNARIDALGILDKHIRRARRQP